MPCTLSFTIWNIFKIFQFYISIVNLFASFGQYTFVTVRELRFIIKRFFTLAGEFGFISIMISLLKIVLKTYKIQCLIIYFIHIHYFIWLTLMIYESRSIQDHNNIIILKEIFYKKFSTDFLLHTADRT